MTCDSLSLWLLSLSGVLLVVLGVVLWLYGAACERLQSQSDLRDAIQEIGNLDAAWQDLRRFLGM